MAKEETKHEGKGKKKHLHKIETVAAGDGTFVHHHHYKEKPEDQHVSHVREHMATSSDADEAGQHVAEQFGMGQQGQEEEGAGDQEAQMPNAGNNSGAPTPME